MDYKAVLQECKSRAELYRGSDAVWNLTHEENCITAITDLLARAEAAEARAEKAEGERDAAVSDLETVMAYGGGSLDTCQFCKNGQCYKRGGAKPCLPKWRGQKEE